MTTRNPSRSLLPVVLALLPACTLPPTQAELLTFKAIAPAHAAYVQADPALDPMAKQRRLDLLEAWRIRVGGAPVVPAAPKPAEAPVRPQ